MGELKEDLCLDCGLPAALESMGERWSFLILRAAFNGLHHFEEFQSTLGIARNIAHSHGGEVSLRNLREGGLRVTLWLPRFVE